MRLIIALLLFAIAAWAAPCSTPTNIAVSHSNGQDWITWTDVDTGAGGAIYRYSLWRDTSAITTTSGLTAIQTGIGYNSGIRNGVGAWHANTTAYRQNASSPMVKLTSGGSALAAYTGLAVVTRTDATAYYYAVTATSTDESCTESGVTAGVNATASPLSGSVAAIQPVRQEVSTDGARNPSVGGISGMTGLPLWLELHNSGGQPYYAPPYFSSGGAASSSTQVRGDLWNFWGDASMGWQDGVNWTPFIVWEDLGHTMHPTITSTTALVMAPFGGEWQKSLTGYSCLGGTATCLASENTYFGLYVAGPSGTKAYPWVEERLAYLVPWVRSNYNADVNRIYGTGHSMGGWGSASWSSKQTSVFAAIFPDRPRWKQRSMPTETGWSTFGYGTPSTGFTLPDGTLFTTYMNQVSTLDCGVPRPPMLWVIGRNDQFATWTEQYEMVNALKACKMAVVMYWNNGTHDNQGLPYKSLIADYAYKYKLNESYPVFTDSSLDDDLGTGINGSGANATATTVQAGADGACASSSSSHPPSCQAYINRGWSWTILTDSATSWSASITNSVGSATVNITPRNTQAFTVSPGTLVSYVVSSGASGIVAADAYGLVTVPSASISGSTTVTLSLTPRLFPLPNSLVR